MAQDIKERIERTAKELSRNYREQGIFDVCIGEKIPKRADVVSILDDLRRLMFPGLFGSENIAYMSFEGFSSAMASSVYEKLFKQIKIAIAYDGGMKEDDGPVEEKAEALAFGLLEELPRIQSLLMKDVRAHYDGDPAARGPEEIILSYPAIYTIFVYRIAHKLYTMGVPYIPRIMTEYAHSETGIDIHPGAEIGEYFFIDHGTGVVIGETTKIGNHVRLYQGVTLGALSLSDVESVRGAKRHPTLGDNVVVYANATILGGDTVVGENTVVAGNTFITHSVDANAMVFTEAPRLRRVETKLTEEEKNAFAEKNKGAGI